MRAVEGAGPARRPRNAAPLLPEAAWRCPPPCPPRAVHAPVRPRRGCVGVRVTTWRARIRWLGRAQAAARPPPDQQKNSTAASLRSNNRLMLVGWGGNNGTTVTAGVLANKL